VLWALARQKAIKAIKVQLRAPFADAYFADHRRELIEEAKAIVSQRKPRTAEAA